MLLLVDFINPLDFPGAEAIRPPAVLAARAAAALRRQMSKGGCATVYANDNYGVWRADFPEIWRRCHAAGAEAAEIARRLKPRRQDYTILKPRHSAFYATPLGLLLEELRCKRLVIAGLAADSCVLFTAMDAYLRGLSIWVPSDCVAAETEEARQAALQQMARVLKADIAASSPAHP
ncbi:MAG TPA: isochorismatase family cysteine hydrolase [Ideonella sp.]|uniref:cysteine hydrolase family protein n=1 Tax=Ideonella sp. TaxID=1929293 RepID=UPI002D129CDA|nr:isochorismatase family cysteine hydrolase [Ideonella sp.]HSI51846.1 isochorismatase family cysteine hydrolase [Ideonella sp.]